MARQYAVDGVFLNVAGDGREYATGGVFVNEESGTAAAEGSGSASVTGSAEGQGQAQHYGSGSASASGSVPGAGLAVHYGSGVATGAGSAAAEGYALHYGSGEASAVGSAFGEGEAPVGVLPAEGSGVASATGSVVGEGYALHSGSGEAGAVGSATGAAGVSATGGGGPDAEVFDAPYRAYVKRVEAERLAEREAKVAAREEAAGPVVAAPAVELVAVLPALVEPGVGLERMAGPAPAVASAAIAPPAEAAEVQDLTAVREEARRARQEREMQLILTALLMAA